MRALLLLLPALAIGQVDRVSERVASRLAGNAEARHLRSLKAAVDDGERALVTAATMGAPKADTETVTLTVELPGAGPRLLVVDAGLVFRGPADVDYVLVPYQRFVLEKPSQTIEVEALPLWPERPRPTPGTPLGVVRSNDAGVIAVLRTAHHLEAEDVVRLTRYVREEDGRFEIDDRVRNRDVELAGWMTWRRNVADKLEGRLPRDALRLALFAVTADFTIQETADWLRRARSMDMEPAIAEATRLARQVEYILERAGLNFRRFSHEHTDFHLEKGVAAFKERDLKGAEKAFRAALDRQPNNVRAQYDLGVVYYRAGDYRKAADAFLVASGMRGADADVFYNRGAALYRLGDNLGAARAFRKALELNPRDPDAAKWLQRADPEGRTKPKPKQPERKKRRRRR